MSKAAKLSKKPVPSNIDEKLVDSIKIPVGKFNFKIFPLLIRVFLVVAVILLPIDAVRQGELMYTAAGVFAWIFHAAILSIPIFGLIYYLFKYEVNEFGIKCFSVIGGAWFVEWDNFESVEIKRFLGCEYISIQPTDNAWKFAIIKMMADYDLFKALCFKLSKKDHKLIELL